MPSYQWCRSFFWTYDELHHATRQTPRNHQFTPFSSPAWGVEVMSTDATKWAWSLAGLRSMERLILLSLADRADEYSRCYPSIKRLEHDTCADRKTVIKTIGRLESKGLLITDKRRGAVTKYQLIGVVDSRDQPTHTSTKNGTTERSQPVPKTGLVHESIPVPNTVPVPKMVPVPKTVPDQYQKRYPEPNKNLSRTYQSDLSRTIAAKNDVDGLPGSWSRFASLTGRGRG